MTICIFLQIIVYLSEIDLIIFFPNGIVKICRINVNTCVNVIRQFSLRAIQRFCLFVGDELIMLNCYVSIPLSLCSWNYL